MENVILTVHLILALLLIGVVLLQRSEGGGLGMGGGGGGGVMTGRQAANALSKLTWIFAIGFIITSISLTVIAARNASTASVVDIGTVEAPAPATPPTLPGLTLPALPSDSPATPPPAN
ncbi:MAG: preprotein translocase subunit SecG [Rhodobacteraceae bacterium]|nr:preprotein translocase subunit SecG [Paracoccaceae bacterium]